MSTIDFLLGVAAILTSIYYSIKLGLYIKQSYPYIKTVLPWRKIGFKTINGLRFFGIIIGVGALVVSGMVFGSLLISGVTTLYENLPEDQKVSNLSPELSLLILIPIIIGFVILLGHFLTKIGEGFQSMHMFPKF